MANRIQLNDDAMENVVGGNITFDWNGKVGHCGLNGDKSYTFSSRSAFVAAVMQCYQEGLSDAECLQRLIANGVIH